MAVSLSHLLWVLVVDYSTTQMNINQMNIIPLSAVWERYSCNLEICAAFAEKLLPSQSLFILYPSENNLSISVCQRCCESACLLFTSNHRSVKCCAHVMRHS